MLHVPDSNWNLSHGAKFIPLPDFNFVSFIIITHRECIWFPRLHKGIPSESANLRISHVVHEVDHALRSGRRTAITRGADVPSATVVTNAHVTDLVGGDNIVWVIVIVELAAEFVSEDSTFN